MLSIPVPLRYEYNGRKSLNAETGYADNITSNIINNLKFL